MRRRLSHDVRKDARVARRVVSLVPSDTESVVVMAGLDRLVGRTDFCTEPPEVLTRPSVGGTKRADVPKILALAPDLVLANREENGPRDVEALEAAGVRVHVSFPCTLAASRAHLGDLGALLGCDPSTWQREDPVVAPALRPRVAVVIWRDPWMSLDGRTFASDVLAAAGADNVFEDRPRRYPLAADLDPDRPELRTDKDTRYPRFALDELIARRPDVVLLPDEPYAFGEAERTELQTALANELPHVRVALCSGKDLFWYGVRAVGSVGRVRSLLASLAP